MKNPGPTLDYLISNSNGNTFHFTFECCPLSLLKEAILRGFQVQRIEENGTKIRGAFSYKNGAGIGNGYGEDSDINYGGGFIPLIFVSHSSMGRGVSPGAGLTKTNLYGLVSSNEISSKEEFCGFSLVKEGFVNIPSESYNEDISYPYELRS